MPNRRYQKGARAEYIVRGALQAEGWLVMRAYASKGAFDLLAVAPASKGPRVALVEVKSHLGYMPPGDRRALAALALEYDAEPVYAHYEDGIITWRRIGPDGVLEGTSWTA